MSRLPFLLPAALALLPFLPACDSSSHEPEVGGPDPADLRIRQTPNDTVRAGTTVTFNAVYADSMRAGGQIGWSLNYGTEQGAGRVVEWKTPPNPGVYEAGLIVSRRNGRRALLGFRTVVIP